MTREPVPGAIPPGPHHLEGRPPRGYWVLGHRGARHYAAGNSLKALELALTLGADGVEVDLRRTGDGQWVAYHDKTVAEGGRRREVARVERGRLGDRAASLDEFLAWAGRHPEALLNVEVKDPGHEAELVAVFRPMAPQCVFTSYIPDVVWALRRHEPGFVTGLLASHPGEFNLEIARMAGCRLIVWRDEDVTQERVAKARGLGLDVFVWDVMSRRRTRSLAGWGVAGVITDRMPGVDGPKP